MELLFAVQRFITIFSVLRTHSVKFEAAFSRRVIVSYEKLKKYE